jgi:hypothetical protein
MLWLKYLLIIVFLATVIIGVGYMPVKLTADNERIAVKRLFGPLELSRNEITEIRLITKKTIDGSIRTFGSGGLFGYIGKFKSDIIGKYTMYATELDNLVLIRTKDDKQYVFSCSRPKEFIDYMQHSPSDASLRPDGSGRVDAGNEKGRQEEQQHDDGE